MKKIVLLFIGFSSFLHAQVESARSVISEEVPFVIRLERDETILPIKINATFELNDNEVKQLSKKLIKQLPNIKQNSNDLFELKNSYTFTFENEKLTIVESSLSSQMETDYNKELPYSVKTNYENGVRLSFADWGAAGVDDYLADASSKPRDYVDPYDARNSFTASSTVTVAWNEGASNEEKLEKIITQKWINNFTNTLESWTDFRRTGYPRIPKVAKNDSSPDWGVIPDGEFIKRMPFVNGERTGSAPAVADATTKLGGADLISTRLWWDVAGPNF